MNEFQASLIAIGGAVIVGVLFYDKWREWRAKNLSITHFPIRMKMC